MVGWNRIQLSPIFTFLSRGAQVKKVTKMALFLWVIALHELGRPNSDEIYNFKIIVFN